MSRQTAKKSDRTSLFIAYTGDGKSKSKSKSKSKTSAVLNMVYRHLAHDMTAAVVQMIKNPDDFDYGDMLMLQQLAAPGLPVNYAMVRADWQQEFDALARRIAAARKRLATIAASEDIWLAIAKKSLAVGVDRHRSDIVMRHAAKALAAWPNRPAVTSHDIDEVAELALPHRVRRQAFDDMGVPA